MMGRIAAPHGVRGEIKVQPHSVDPTTLLAHREWWIRTRGPGSQWQCQTWRSGRVHGATIVASLEGIDERDAAARLRGAEVGVPRSSLPEPAEGEYYRDDLVGMRVVNRDGVELGRVAGFVDSAAHPLLQVQDSGGIQRLIPWVGQYVMQVGVDVGVIDVDWPAEP